MFILLGDIILRKEDIISIVSTGNNTCEITFKTSSEDQDSYEVDISIKEVAKVLIGNSTITPLELGHMSSTLYGPGSTITLTPLGTIDSIIKE